MKRGSIFGLVSFLFFINISFIENGLAQNTSYEFWPEVDVWYRFNPAWRMSAFVPITKYNESKFRDINVYLHLDYSWGHSPHLIYRRLVDQEKEQLMRVWMVRIGLMEGRSLGENAGNYIEDMLFAEIHKRIPIKGEILLSHRIRYDTRWLGEDNTFSYRLRYRIMFEKEYNYKNLSIVPYVNVEPYWDSRYSKIIKTRAIAGATTSWGSIFALEGNITYQYDTTYDTTNLYALNIILHVYLQKKQKSTTTSKPLNP